MIDQIYGIVQGGAQVILWPSIGSGGAGPSPSGGGVSGVHRSGKGKKRDLIVRLSDVESREDTAEFLKAQLRLRHQNPVRTFEEAPAEDDRKAKREAKALAKREAKMRADAARIEAEMAAVTAAAELEAKVAAEEERKRRLKIYNDGVLALLLLAAQEME